MGVEPVFLVVGVLILSGFVVTRALVSVGAFDSNVHHGNSESEGGNPRQPVQRERGGVAIDDEDCEKRHGQGGKDQQGHDCESRDNPSRLFSRDPLFADEHDDEHYGQCLNEYGGSGGSHADEPTHRT